MQILTFQTARSLNDLIKDTSGAVIFIECRAQPELVGLIQIAATNNFPSHVALMQRNNPFPLYLRGYLSATDVEKTLQTINDKFGKFIYRLPWFVPGNDLLEFIEKSTTHPPKQQTVPTNAIVAAAKETEIKLVSVEEVAKQLNMSVPTIRRLEQNGKIPSVRTGRLVRFYMPDVLNTLLGAQNKK